MSSNNTLRTFKLYPTVACPDTTHLGAEGFVNRIYTQDYNAVPIRPGWAFMIMPPPVEGKVQTLPPNAEVYIRCSVSKTGWTLFSHIPECDRTTLPAGAVITIPH